MFKRRRRYGHFRWKSIWRWRRLHIFFEIPQFNRGWNHENQKIKTQKFKFEWFKFRSFQSMGGFDRILGTRMLRNWVESEDWISYLGWRKPWYSQTWTERHLYFNSTENGPSGYHSYHRGLAQNFWYNSWSSSHSQIACFQTMHWGVQKRSSAGHGKSGSRIFSNVFERA